MVVDVVCKVQFLYTVPVCCVPSVPGYEDRKTYIPISPLFFTTKLWCSLPLAPCFVANHHCWKYVALPLPLNITPQPHANHTHFLLAPLLSHPLPNLQNQGRLMETILLPRRSIRRWTFQPAFFNSLRLCTVCRPMFWTWPCAWDLRCSPLWIQRVILFCWVVFFIDTDPWKSTM